MLLGVADIEQRPARQAVEELAALDHEVEVVPGQPCMLARDVLRPRSLTGADRLDQRVMLVLRDDEDVRHSGS